MQLATLTEVKTSWQSSMSALAR